MQISISAGNLQLTVTIDAGMILALIVAFKSITHQNRPSNRTVSYLAIPTARAFEDSALNNLHLSRLVNPTLGVQIIQSFRRSLFVYKTNF